MIGSIVLISLILFCESIGIGSRLWPSDDRVSSMNERVSRPGRSLTFPDTSMILVRKVRWIERNRSLDGEGSGKNGKKKTGEKLNAEITITQS